MKAIKHFITQLDAWTMMLKNECVCRNSWLALIVLLAVGWPTGLWAAVPDGFVRASDYASLNAAVSAATSQNKAGVYVPANFTASATGPILLPANFTLLGEDNQTSVVRFTAMTNYDGFMVANGLAGNIRFQTLTIDATAVTPPSGSNFNTHGVVNLSTSGNVVEAVRFVGAPRMAVQFTGSGNLVENSTFMNNGFIAIVIAGTSNKVLNNTISGGTWYGIRPSGSNHQIVGNHITQLTTSGGVGIYFSGLSNSLIKDNVIDNVQDHGMFGSGAGTSQNAFLSNTLTGIGTVNGQALDPAGTGIAVWPGADHNLIAFNQAANCLGYGLLVAGSYPSSPDAPFNILSDNQVSGSSDPGIVVSGASDALVRRNASNANYSTGFTLGSDAVNVSSPRLRACNNTANQNWLEGFHLNAVANGLLIGNTATNNGWGSASGHVSAGVQVSGSGLTASNVLQNNVSQNTTTSNQRYGICLNTGVSGNAVQYNDLYPDATSGLLDNSSQSNTIANNRTASSTTVLQTAPPVANAGPGALLIIGDTGALNGTGSHVMAGTTGTFSYAWTQVYGPTVTIGNAGSAQASFTAPAVTQLTLLGFRLTVSNANGSTYDDVYFAVLAQVSVRGTISLANYGGDPRDVLVRIDWRQQGVVRRTDRVFLDAQGGFTIRNVDIGTYDIAVKTSGWLQKVLTSRGVSTSLDLGTITLTGGDVTGSNAVDAADLSVVLGNLDQIGQ